VPSPRTNAPEGAPDRCQVRRPFVISGRGAHFADQHPVTGWHWPTGTDRLALTGWRWPA